MSTLHTYAEAAIRRDLTRARHLLGTRARLTTDRRLAVTDHLVWLASFVHQGTPAVSPAVADLREAAIVFGRTGTAPDREALVGAVSVVLKVTASHDGTWTAPEVARTACGNLPWVLDAAAIHGGPGLVLPRTASPQDARSQAAEYRRKRTLLWGPIALAPLRVLEEAVR